MDAAEQPQAGQGEGGEREGADCERPSTISLPRQMRRADVSWTSVSFACGGWLQFYMFGVARALQHCGVDKGVTYAGCSAGALTAAGLALEGDFDEAVLYCKEYCLPKAFAGISGLFKLDHYVEVCLKRVCNVHRWRELADGQLQVAVTRLLPYFRKERRVAFESEEDLLDSLVASAAAFPFAPLVYRHGSWCVDGGLSDFQPIVDSATVTVSPFYFSRADIKPSRYVPLWWALLPPNDDDTIDWLYHLGWTDGLSWLQKQGVDTSVATREPVRNVHPFDTPGKISMHRFLGYTFMNNFGRYMSYLGDVTLFLMLAVIWKPVSLMLIYLEVAVLLVFHFFKAVLFELLYAWPFLLATAYWLEPSWLVSVFVLTLALFHKILIFGPSKKNKWQDVWECLSIFGSTALLSKFYSMQLSSASRGKQNYKMDLESYKSKMYHAMVEKTSIMYRVAKHFL
jgi:hypothetical protein